VDSILATIGTLVEQQAWLAFPVCFLGGLVSSASPCVLAMIPLVIGFVGGYAEGSQRKAVQYSLFFVLGLTITFTTLGLAAGLLGMLFGDIGSIWKYLLPALAILLGLQLLGVIKFSPQVSERFMPKKKALLGAFLMGLMFGIVASPCATPVLAVILTFAAVQQEVAYSCGLLLAYAMGHWVLVLGVGISAGFAQKVIASKGMASLSEYSKKAAGVLLMGAGVYLIYFLF
jgi:cytochrome c-type biogenesis protein